jgi:hypothetical protein
VLVFFFFLTQQNLCTSSSNHFDEQVIAPLLIVLRVANRTESTRDGVAPGTIGTIRFGSRGMSTTGYETATFHNANPETSTEGSSSETAGRPSGVGNENFVEEVPLLNALNSA